MEDQIITLAENKTIFDSDVCFLGKTVFKQKEKKPKSEDVETTLINAKVYAIRLHRVLDENYVRNKELRQSVRKLFGLKRVRDLVHTLCALYDTSLPDIGPSPVYECITGRKSFTICIFRDDQCPNGESSSSSTGEAEVTAYETDDCLSEVLPSSDESQRIFRNIFSGSAAKSSSDAKSSSSSEDEESESAEPDQSTGVKSFIKANESKTKKINIVHGLLGCATLEKVNTYQQPGQEEWVIDLQLMSVRDKYRGCKIGKYLIGLIQNRHVMGSFDAIVTSSDTDAISFYEKYSFSLDPILNSKYSNIGDIWTNTTKMCYIPPYCCTAKNEDFAGLNSTSFIQELTQIEKDHANWQKSMFTAYQTQAKLFMKLKQEILNLKASLCMKESTIEELRFKNDILERKNRFLKLKLLEHNVDFTENENPKNGEAAPATAPDDGDDIGGIISQLESLSSLSS